MPDRYAPKELGPPLLTTKLNVPPRRQKLVPRSQLLARLAEAQGLHCRLILVSARAGSGKTTLVSQWLRQQDQPVAWLSLDAEDNEPRRFSNYLLAALERVGVEIPSTLLGPLAQAQLPEAEALVAELINGMATKTVPFLLVLDDYHLIEDEWIHETVRFFVENQPPGARLVLITRVDPPLALARLRGRGQLVEIRDRDLRFTPEEVAQFFNDVMDLGLPPAALSALEERTEGWIVGLQMAAILMQGRKREGDLNAFLTAFSGTNRYILDYLMEEVLGRQTPAIQRFLIETSILERMCGELCDAVRFGEGQTSVDVVPERDSGQAILAQLERANLFVVALDDARQWYRYHHLFADLLQSSLREQRSEVEIQALHRRASYWYQQNGFLEEAVSHAIAAGAYERAAAIIDENIVQMLSQSEGPVLLGWIKKLPQDLARGRPWIDIYRAYTLALSGWADEAEARLDGAQKRIAAEMPRAAELMGHIAAIRSYTANLSGDAERVFEMATLSEEYLPEDHLIARAMVVYALAATHFARDDMASATQAAVDMLHIGKRLDRLLMIITALCDLASAKKVQGQLHQAADYYERAWRWLLKRKGLDSRLRCPYEVGRADLLLRWNRLDAAQEQAVTGIAYGRRFHVPSEEVDGYLTLMRVCQARGDVDGALDALRHAEQLAETHSLRLAPAIRLRTARVVQWLSVGDIDNATHWAARCDGGTELEHITLARLRLAQGQPAAALQLLEAQQAAAEAGERHGRLLEILALQAVVLEALGRADEAEARLVQALALARPEGYLYPFLALGAPLQALLLRLAAKEPLADDSVIRGPSIVTTFLDELLVAFQQQQERQWGREAPLKALSVAHAAAPTEPLTERELDVLRLLAEGLTNREIGAQLVVAPSTIKQHLKHIYGKLDVHSRTEAVTRGREAGLLW